MSAFERRIEVVKLYPGDWQTRIDDARDAVAAAQGKKGIPRTLDETESDYDRLAQAYNELCEQAEAEGVVRVTVQALPRRQWADLVAEHPPRVDDSVPVHIRQRDAEFGVNDDGMSEALVPISIKKIEPEMTVEELLDGVNSAQFDLIYSAAFAANRGRGSDPKDAPRLPLSQSSSATEN